MNEYAVGCLPLARIAGNGIAVVEMRMALRIEIYNALVVQLQPYRSVRRDVFHCTQFTVRNFQFMIRRGELDTVSNRECLLLLAIHGDAPLAARVIGRFTPIHAQHREPILLSVDALYARVFTLL